MAEQLSFLGTDAKSVIIKDFTIDKFRIYCSDKPYKELVNIYNETRDIWLGYVANLFIFMADDTYIKKMKELEEKTAIVAYFRIRKEIQMTGGDRK